MRRACSAPSMCRMTASGTRKVGTTSGFTVRYRTRLALNSLIVAVALLAAGCCQHSKCGGPPAEIVVRDQAGMLPPGTTVSNGGVTVTEQRCRAKDQCAFPVARVGT